MIRRSAVVTGRVQGVSFRYYTVLEADRLGATGWVRNRPDGAVELEAQGHPAAVDALLEWAQTGPAHARVRRMKTETRPVVEGEIGFTVLP